MSRNTCIAGVPDVMAQLEHFGETALRIKAERDELAKALSRLLEFLDNAADHELQNPRGYMTYINARAALAKVSL